MTSGLLPITTRPLLHPRGRSTMSSDEVGVPQVISLQVTFILWQTGPGVGGMEVEVSQLQVYPGPRITTSTQIQSSMMNTTILPSIATFACVRIIWTEQIEGRNPRKSVRNVATTGWVLIHNNMDQW